MFFVKSKHKKVQIDYENVYTICPGCGREFQVYFFQDLAKDEDFDICTTAIYCAKCSERRARERAQVLRAGEPSVDARERGSTLVFESKNLDGRSQKKRRNHAKRG